MIIYLLGHVDDASGFAVGQAVFVQRAVTAKWVAAQGMNDLVRNGAPQTWIKVCHYGQSNYIIRSRLTFI